MESLTIPTYGHHLSACPSRVASVAYRIVWNRADAQDVVQIAFLQALQHRDQLIDPGRGRVWLLSITYREALQRLRARRDIPTDPVLLPGAAQLASDPADIVAASELATIVRQSIDTLPDGLRTAFVLRDVEDLTLAEVAAVLDIGLSAAKMRVSRAREHLRRELTGKI